MYRTLGVLIIRILLFRVLYWGPLFSETPCIDFRFPLVGRAVLRNAERTGQTTGASDPRAREISNRAPT